jgi:uncharacterized protein (DUF362 family)
MDACAALVYTKVMTRRELLTLAASAALLKAERAPAPPVSIAKCNSYDDDLVSAINTMFDQIGGAGRLVANKTVTIKLNLTGSPGLRFKGRALGVTHYTHPKTIGAMVNVLGRAGAKRVRLVESAWGTSGPLEEYMLDSGWNVKALQNAAPKVEFENTNALGSGKKYVRFHIPSGGYIFPAYELNHSYYDTDVFVSMAKLKNHATCGVTLSMKNIFGITPASIYGDDAGMDTPNESPNSGRVNTCHLGKRQPAKIAPAEIDAKSSREPGYRMPRVVSELNAARPIDIAFIDGIDSVTGGEGPWIEGLKLVHPGVLILGTNAVSTDAVGTAVMGYDPRADRDTPPFRKCDNMLKLAEVKGVGSADLKRIEVRGVSIADALFRYEA